MVIINHIDSNISVYLPKITLFLKDCATWSLSRVLSDRKSIYKIKYSHRSALQFALFQIKIRLLERDQKRLRPNNRVRRLTFIKNMGQI